LFEESTAEFKEKYKQSRSLVYKIYYKFLYIIFKILRITTKLMPNNLNGVNKTLNQFDVYQSFFYAIPNFVNKNRNIAKMIIVHDLIPIKYPEFFLTEKKHKKNNPVKKFGTIFDSIKEDTTIFCDSECTKKDLLEFYPRFKNNKIIINYLAADKQKFFYLENRENTLDNNFKNIKQSLGRYNIPTEKHYFLSICSLNPRKNLKFLVDSFTRFLDKNKHLSSEINLVLSGPKGWKVEELLNQVAKSECHKHNIIITGFIEEQDINNIYNGAMAFVYPSLYEGFGLPVLEAMQCRIPIIASNSSSIPEIVENAGILIDSNDENDLINAFEKLYNDQVSRENLARIGENKSREFDWYNTTKVIIKEYKLIH
jgi:glycosyltransferase involved in cell wall biosynthesis